MKKRIFIGSSTESLPTVNKVALIVEQCKCEAVRWDEPNCFPPGDFSIDVLINKCNEVNGAIFIFAEDDKVWYRDSKVHQPRDNVLVEYGVFAGILGRRNAIIAMHNSPRIPTDILGITVVNLDKPEHAREQISKWLNSFGRISTVPFLNGKWSYEGGNDDSSYMVAGECKIDQTGRQLRFWGTRQETTKMDGDKRIVDSHHYEWRSTWARVCVADGRVRVEYQIHRNAWFDGFINAEFQDGDPDTITGIFFFHLPPDTISGRIVFRRLTHD